MSVINQQCSFCDNFADVMLGSEGNSVPACMKCVDKKLDENLDKIDREKNEKLIKCLKQICEI